MPIIPKINPNDSILKAPRGARLSWLANSEKIQELLKGRLDAGLKPATALRDRAAISALLGHHLGEATRREILHKRVKIKHPDNGRLRWLAKEEIARLRNFLRGLVDRLVSLAFNRHKTWRASTATSGRCGL